MAKRKLTPRTNDGPPPSGWTLDEALRKLAGEECVQAYLAAKQALAEARATPKDRPRWAFNRVTKERINLAEQERNQRITSASDAADETERALLEAFRRTLQTGEYRVKGRPGKVDSELIAIDPDQVAATDQLDLDRAILAEKRPGGGRFVSVRVYLASAEDPPQGRGGRPSSIDWFAALDEFLLTHIREGEFESKTMLAEKLSEAIYRTGRSEPDLSTVRKWLGANLPRLYGRSDALHGQEAPPSRRGR